MIFIKIMGYVSSVATNKNRILNHARLIKEQAGLLNASIPNERSLCRAGHIELQLTDKCSLNCPNCHFRGLGDKQFSFEWLDNVIKFVQPKAITLAGGGEPTIYPRFNDAVLKLAEIPEVQIGLITNGTIYPHGPWVRHIKWVRVSFYSIDDGTYSGKSIVLRGIVLNNIGRYLRESGIPNVGVHFLFYRKNMSDIIPFAKEIYSRFREDRESFQKMHIQFKPAFIMARPSHLTSKLHEENIEFLPSHSQVEDILSNFEYEFSADEEFRGFLHSQSNFQVFNQLANGYLDELVNVTNPGNFPLKVSENKECHVCLAYRLIDPSGFIYPCLTLAEHRSEKFSLGHISELPKIDVDRLRGFRMAATECCNKFFCRNWSQNQIVGEYMKKPARTELSDDCFF